MAFYFFKSFFVLHLIEKDAKRSLKTSAAKINIWKNIKTHYHPRNKSTKSEKVSHLSVYVFPLQQ